MTVSFTAKKIDAIAFISNFVSISGLLYIIDSMLALQSITVKNLG